MDAKKKTFIEALHHNFGHITKACQTCNISRRTYYDWIAADEEFKNHVENIGEYIIDTVESELYKQIKEGTLLQLYFF